MPTGPRPFIPADRCARLELIYVQNGQICENVVYVRGTENWGTSDLTELANSARVAWDATLGVQANENTVLSMIRATAIDVFPAAQVEVPSTAAGNQTGAGVPGNVTVVTKFSGGLTGRSTRGRAYFVGLDNGDVDGNQLVAGRADDFSIAWESFFSDLHDAVHNEPQHVIVSYVEDNDWRTEALVTQVINYSTDNNLDSQRRRLTGRGL